MSGYSFPRARERAQQMQSQAQAEAQAQAQYQYQSQNPPEEREREHERMYREREEDVYRRERDVYDRGASPSPSPSPTPTPSPQSGRERERGYQPAHTDSPTQQKQGHAPLQRERSYRSDRSFLYSCEREYEHGYENERDYAREHAYPPEDAYSVERAYQRAHQLAYEDSVRGGQGVRGGGHGREEGEPEHDVERYTSAASSSEKKRGSEAGGEDGEELVQPDDPVIKTGADVSKYVVSMADAGDPALTFRGCVVGVLVLLLQSAVTQVYSAKPIQLTLSNVFMILICWALLYVWSVLLPQASWVEGTRLHGLAPALRFVNPGRMGLKEHVVAVALASAGMYGGSGSNVLATLKLFYDDAITPTMAVFGLLSIGVLGVGLVGLLRPIIIYPSEMVYWYTLPMVAVFSMLHHERGKDKKRLKAFSLLFGVTCLWEPIVAYIAPMGNGVSVFCLASMGAPMRIRRHIARIFGGASSNQGLGLLSLSFDPQFVSPSQFAGFPLKWQVNYWLGSLIGCIFILSLYYSDTWRAQTFPFMSQALFTANGTHYPQRQIFDADFRLDEAALEELGTPRLAASALWSYLCQTMAVGALITHISIFWATDILRFIKENATSEHHDPHYIAMKRYPEVPPWWYGVCWLIAVGTAFLTVCLSSTSLPAWGLLIAILVGTLVAPFSAVLYASYGSAVATNMLSKMVAGGIHSGRPVANLWFSNYCHQVVNVVVNLSDFLKIGQYLKVPWRVMFGVQVAGVVIGSYFNWFIISMVIDHKREILLDPIGNAQWSGGFYQSLNSQAVEWSLAGKVFRAGSGLGYEIVPLGLLIGGCFPPVHWLLKRYSARVRNLGDMITTPLVLFYLQGLSGGITSVITSTILMGVFMQLYLRVKKPRIFREWAYLLSASVDGAAQIMSFILSIAVFGANGHPQPFPTWFGNPSGPPDHCVTTEKY